MLHEFLSANRVELVNRCRAKVGKRPSPEPTVIELEFGIPLFLEQLISTLQSEESQTTEEEAGKSSTLPSEIGTSAEKHGTELLRKGFTVDQVVHDYGDLCQAITELASEKKAPVTVEEFHTFNRCLDNAIADAVTKFGRERDRMLHAKGNKAMNERLGVLAHELRNLLNTAMLAFQAMKSGNVALSGATGSVLDRSLIGLRNLIDRSLAEVRLTAGLKAQREQIRVAELLEEVQVSASMEAKVKGIAFSIAVVDRKLWCEADRDMLSSALSNLLQNAFKFTKAGSRVSLRANEVADHIVIEVEDECGGLPQGKTEELFQPFEQRSADRTGLGLGLSISRRGIEANGGTLRVRNLAGKGCIFTIDLPRNQAASSSSAIIPDV